MNRLLLPLALLLLLPPLVGHRSGGSLRAQQPLQQVTISEFMYSPDSSANEWIELYNYGTLGVVLTDWTISDANDTTALFDSIDVGEYMIVSRRPAMFAAQYGNVPCKLIDVNFQQYNETGDVIIIRNKAGDTIDMVTYDNSWNGERGRSFEKISPTLNSRLRTSWSLSTNPAGATPCGRNSVSAAPRERLPDPPRVRVVERRTITVEFSAPGEDRSIVLYPVDGRKLALRGTAPVTTVGRNSARIECPDLPAGLYTLIITDRRDRSKIAVPVVLP